MTKAEPKRRMAEKADSELVRDLKASADSIEDEDFWPEKILMFQARDRIQELEAENEALRHDVESYMRTANEFVNVLSGVHAGSHCIVPVEPDLKVLKSMRASYELFSDMDKVYRAALSATKESG